MTKITSANVSRFPLTLESLFGLIPKNSHGLFLPELSEVWVRLQEPVTRMLYVECRRAEGHGQVASRLVRSQKIFFEPLIKVGTKELVLLVGKLTGTLPVF